MDLLNKIVVIGTVLLAVFVITYLKFAVGVPFDWAVPCAVAAAFIVLALVDWVLVSVNVLAPLRDRLVADWKQAWRWISVQMMALAGVLQLLGLALEKAWLQVPPSLLEVIPASTIQTVSLVVLLVGLGGRVLQQQRDAAGK